ncbi:MFS general substrate transporter [Eremomyces bilateralis CBS 781.70]|uniref:MFS general substrate transporter n=1 Tax=Eremomyces bilateralis CBS 781.70 TaxID=1392243 RepID=A0A6G1G991_9PEZI|nr:MFS general substrate transporter [Eremomyces bilateralis CBS 781.70]KAF1814648.1 MFS general substrate transporter [Eremomyces bilateralis CBS 781.70]
MADDESVRDYGPAAPHGPNMDHIATRDVFEMNNLEESAFKRLLRPDDSYDTDGTYWGDMSMLRRLKFVSKVDAEEFRREIRDLGRMFKKDPLSPFGMYLRNAVIPGAGLGLEGYVLFSIGNVRPLLQAAFPACWKTHEVCDKTWVEALENLEIVGIILGQILVGFQGDWIGRRFGLLQDAWIMLIGLIMLTAAWGVTQNGWVICYVWSLFIYSIGVGGEYPMTATSGMENAIGAGKISTREDRLHRGRKVTSAFLMQGWGQLFNLIILMLCLLAFHSGSNPPYGKTSAQWTYRVSFGIPAVGTLWLLYYRTYKMKGASTQLKLAKKKTSVTGYDVQSLKLTLWYFGPRLFATAMGWFLNDFLFYGSKLFQSQFIAVLLPGNKSVMVGWLYSLINTGVSLVGYYLASFLIDNKIYGRKHMQSVGFICDFILFAVPAFNFDYYTSTAHVHEFQAMYFLASFFQQFGPNAVTFLVAAEVFPTPIRATAHGFSAACGKLGALAPAVLYNYIDDRTKFKVVPWFGLAGVLVTVLFLPDTTGLDLKEQERRWRFIRAGREHEYHGTAIHWRHISWWERFRGVHKPYDAALDFAQKLEEMRADWEVWRAHQGAEDAVVGGLLPLEHLEHLEALQGEGGGHVHGYFGRTGVKEGVEVEKEKEKEKGARGEGEEES